MCVCGRTLGVRRGVIHAARVIAAKQPHYPDRELAGLAGGELANWPKACQVTGPSEAIDFGVPISRSADRVRSSWAGTV